VEGRPSNTTWKQYLQRVGAPIVFDTLHVVGCSFVSMEVIEEETIEFFGINFVPDHT